jgi:hypothetical protein
MLVQEISEGFYVVIAVSDGEYRGLTHTHVLDSAQYWMERKCTTSRAGSQFRCPSESPGAATIPRLTPCGRRADALWTAREIVLRCAPVLLVPG